MKAMRFLGLAAVMGLTVGMAGRADAGIISYDYSTTLALVSGPDSAGLDGAKVDVKVDVSTSAVYITRFGYPDVVMNNDATYTISGSSQAANNGTFALSQLAFYPTFAGLFTDPQGDFPVATLPVGGDLTFLLNTFPTAHGSSVVAGDTVNVLDFAPAVSHSFNWTGSSGAEYAQVNPTVTATTTVPEPSSLVLTGIAGVVGLAFRRARKRAGM